MKSGAYGTGRLDGQVTPGWELPFSEGELRPGPAYKYDQKGLGYFHTKRHF